MAGNPQIVECSLSVMFFKRNGVRMSYVAEDPFERADRNLSGQEREDRTQEYKNVMDTSNGFERTARLIVAAIKWDRINAARKNS